MSLEKIFRKRNRHETEKVEQAPELQAFLKSFDFDCLDELIRELKDSVRYHGTTAPVLRADRVSSPRGNESEGMYDDEHRLISLNNENVRLRAQANGADPDSLLRCILIHEEIHAISDKACLEPDTEQGGRHIGYVHGGLFRMWTEGVTEKLAREIHSQYELRKFGSEEKNVQSIRDVHALRRSSSYQPEIELTEAFITRIAQRAGVDQDLVWKSIINGLLRGEQWDPRDFDEFATDILPPHFMHDVARFSQLSSFRLTKELQSPSDYHPALTSKISRSLIRTAEAIFEGMANAHRR